VKARESKGKPTKTGKASESRESKPKNFPSSPKHSKDARQKKKTPRKRPRDPRPSKILPKLPPNPAPNLPKSFQNPPQTLPKAVQNPNSFPIDFWTAYFPLFPSPREAQELPNELQIQSKIDEKSTSKNTSISNTFFAGFLSIFDLKIHRFFNQFAMSFANGCEKCNLVKISVSPRREHYFHGFKRRKINTNLHKTRWKIKLRKQYPKITRKLWFGSPISSPRPLQNRSKIGQKSMLKMISK